MNWFVKSGEGVVLLIHAVPRADRSALGGIRDGRLVVRLKAPPSDGRANRELVRYLAERFAVRKADVVIERGATGRAKRVLVRGSTIDPDALLEP